MRALLALAVTSFLIPAGMAVAADGYFFRNVTPSIGGKGATTPTTGGTGGETTTPTDGSGGTGTGTGTPTTPVVTPAPDIPEDGTVPLKLVLSPDGPINATSTAPVRAVFHASGGCASKSFRIQGASADVLAGFGLTAAASGSDYVISGQINRAGYGGTYGITVTARDSCSNQQSVTTDLNLNPAPADYDPPWDLRVENTVAFVGRQFGFYPEFQNHGSNYEEVDQTGFTFSIHTLDPTNRPIPAWLTMPDPSTGVLLGTAPAAAGSFGPFYMTVKAPNNGPTQSTDFTVVVTPSVTFSGPNSVELIANEAKSVTFTGSGGCNSVNTYYGVDSSTRLPTGMTLTDFNGKWTVQGTPTEGGTWPVRFTYTDYACGGTQVFPVTFTVTGAPVPPLTFRSAPDFTPTIVVGGNPQEQLLQGLLDDMGSPWNTITCTLIDPDGNKIPWSTQDPYPSRKDVCLFTLNPTTADQVGDHPVRVKAVTDTRGEAISSQVVLKVTTK